MWVVSRRFLYNALLSCLSITLYHNGNGTFIVLILVGRLPASLKSHLGQLSVSIGMCACIFTTLFSLTFAIGILVVLTAVAAVCRS